MSDTRAVAFPWYDPRAARGRLLIALIAGAATAFALPASLSWAGRAVGGWDVGALIMLGIAWSIIWRADPEETRRRAGSDDPGRSTVWAIVLATSSTSLFAATIAMRHTKTLVGGEADALVGMCLLAVVAAWTVTHTSYTLRYAHLYYRDEGEEGGFLFPGDQPPCDMDFAYFSFVIGMCFQTSDVSITSQTVRRGVLGHSVLSFAYNTAIVALTLNFVFSFLGS